MSDGTLHTLILAKCEQRFRELAQVRINYTLRTGENITGEYTVGKNSRFTVEVGDDVGPGQDLSAVVTSSNDVPIICERPVYFSYQNRLPGGHDVTGAVYQQQLYCLAEGTTRPGFDEWICILNPGEE